MATGTDLGGMCLLSQYSQLIELPRLTAVYSAFSLGWPLSGFSIIIVYIICCKKIIMQALVMQFGNDVGTSFLFVYADFGEYSLLRAVVNGL